MEHIGKVFDHFSRTYQLGMRALVYGIWDGKSFISTTFLFITNLIKIEKEV
jgi:hypothetical protein